MQPGEPAESAAPQRARDDGGGRFDFDDGGTYIGGWEEHKANGYGVCTGPKGQGAYSGSWHYGFEVSGVYTWPSGSSFEGQWQNGKRHGLGVETRGRWLYRGEWTQGFKGRYGVRQSTTSSAKYEGTWAHGLQEGYGQETYADGGKYQGQWLRGMRHGYGVRTSAPFGLASQHRCAGAGAGARGSTSSLAEGAPGTPDPAERRSARIDESRGGFVLKARSDEPPARRNSLAEKTKKGLLSGLKIRKQRSTGELERRGGGTGGSIRSGGSASSWVSSMDSSHSGVTHASLHTDSNASFIVEDEHLGADVVETYMGEWKNDKRTGFGVSERSDGLRYEGEWYANRKYGYGVTIFRDGTREEGKYKNNVLITSQKRKHLFLMRSAKFRERIESAVTAAQRASKIALQKADIAVSRSATARTKAEQADEAADQAKEDCEIAQSTAKQFAPDFKQPGLDRIRLREKYRPPPDDARPTKSILHEPEKSIPNHVSSPQQEYKLPNPGPPRRASTAYPRTVQPDAKLPNNGAAYPAADPALAAPDRHPYSGYNDAPSTQAQSATADRFQYSQPDPHSTPTGHPNQTPAHQAGYSNSQMPAYRGPNRQDAGYQSPSDVGSQNYQQQQTGSRRQSYQTTMQSQRQTQEWPNQDSTRRPSVLGNPTQPQRHTQYNSMSNNDYDYRSGAAYSEQSSDRLGSSSRPSEQQYARSPADPYGRSPTDQQYARSPADQYARSPTDYDAADGGRGARPSLTGQTSIDHFDHYKRPPSRDSSVDRYGRRSRQPSVEASQPGPAVGSRSGSVSGGAGPGPTPAPASRPASRAPTPAAGNGHVASGRGSVSRAATREGLPFEESLMRKRTLGQDISPSPYQPKRTESLFVAGNPAPPVVPPATGGGGKGGSKRMLNVPQAIQRKKSLPDVAGYGRGAEVMSREEVSALGSARREEVRRMAEESERLRANPFLYLVSPQVKEWFSRQQLVIVVLFINISLGIMFFKLLT